MQAQIDTKNRLNHDGLADSVFSAGAPTVTTGKP